MCITCELREIRPLWFGHVDDAIMKAWILPVDGNRRKGRQMIRTKDVVMRDM